VWGGIQVTEIRQFFWTYTTQYKTFTTANIAAAEALRKELCWKRENEDGYSRLPHGARIRRTATSARSVARQRP